MYSAPSTSSYRGANGKAVVSTNGDVYVAGWDQGWLLIMYETNNGAVRVGYVNGKDIQGSVNAPNMFFSYSPITLSKSVTLTDDPVTGSSKIASLSSNQQVTYLQTFYNQSTWLYVETQDNGQTVRGFIPSSATDWSGAEDEGVEAIEEGNQDIDGDIVPDITPANNINGSWRVPVLPAKEVSEEPTYTNVGYPAALPVDTVFEDGRDFSDGKAWVKPVGGPWLCIDAGGNILFALRNSDEPASDFSCGIAVINGSTIINDQGVVLRRWSPDSYDGVITDVYHPTNNRHNSTLLKNNGYEPYNAVVDGVVFVKKSYNTFSLTEMRVGVIGYNGEWLCEPSARLAEFVHTFVAVGYGYGYDYEEVYYLGEGWIRATNADFDEDTKDYLYNIYTDTFYTLEAEIWNTSLKRVVGNLRDEVLFTNVDDNKLIAFRDEDVTVYSYNPANDRWLFDTILEPNLLARTSLLGNDRFFVEYSSGLPGAITGPNTYIHEQAFFDVNGKKLALVEYEFNTTPYFAEGYAVADINNYAGVRYLTIIDTSGNFMFEPIKYKDYGEFNSGFLRLTDSNGYKNMVCTFIDVNGNKLGTYTGQEIFDFSEGFARIIFEDGSVNYINSSGSYLLPI